MADVLSLSVPSSTTPDPTLAPWANIRIGAPDAWVEVPSYDTAVQARSGEPSTLLLWSVQHHLERNHTFRASALRFETALSVQHSSQWSIELAPAFQQLHLHWLRVRRGEQVFDQLRRDRIRLIQRETQLEHLVIDGSWTVLIVLEDIRPGDILEVACTLEVQDQIRPGSREALVSLPAGQQIGRYHVAVFADPSLPSPRWKAAAELGAPEEATVAAGLRRWLWQGSQEKARSYDISQGAGWLDTLWLQVSDLADWSALGTAVAAVWEQRVFTADLMLDPALSKPAQVDGAAIAGLIQHLQDAYRYLSLELNACGWIPTEPGEVVRRRYGDCKDLAWLATRVLLHWGVQARPVLVSSYLRGRVAHLLPGARLFSHAIVEVSHAGRRHWFDLTDRMRGGDLSTMGVNWFGQGLVVAPGQVELSAQPQPGKIGAYHLRETFLIDTQTGRSSMLELRLRVEGPQADILRRHLDELGREPFEQHRADVITHRYGASKRNLPLQVRDDRASNVCELVESYELEAFVLPSTNPAHVICQFSRNIVSELMPVPAELERQLPWYLPGPIEVRHEVVARSTALIPWKPVRRKWAHPEFEGSFQVTYVRHSAQSICELRIPAPEVVPERVPEVRKCALELQKLAFWRVVLVRGQARPRRFVGFGILEQTTPPPLPPASVSPAVSPAPARPGNPEIFKSVPTRSRRRAAEASSVGSYRTLGFLRKYRLPIIVIAVVLLLFAGVVYSIYRAVSGLP